MKFTIGRDDLLTPLGHVRGAIQRGATVPIVAAVLIEAGSDRLSLTGTDLDLEIVEKVAADTGGHKGRIAPAAHLFHDIVAKLPEGAEVEIEQRGERVAIRSGRSSFSLPTLPAIDYPVLSPEAARGDALPFRFDLGAASLRAAIDQVRFAISREEARYYLQGIYLHAARNDAGRDVLRAVATDGHRLALADLPLPEGAAGMPGVIVPRKAIAELRRLIDDLDETVAIALSDTRIGFDLGNVVLTSKLIDGTFPDYRRVIPTGNDKIAELMSQAFAEAVDRVAVMASDKSHAISVRFAAGLATLEVRDADTGSATEEFEIGYAGPEFRIGFNANYLLDILGRCTSRGNEGRARLAMGDAVAPVIVTDPAQPDALFVIMPMRV